MKPGQTIIGPAAREVLARRDAEVLVRACVAFQDARRQTSGALPFDKLARPEQAAIRCWVSAALQAAAETT